MNRLGLVLLALVSTLGSAQATLPESAPEASTLSESRCLNLYRHYRRQQGWKMFLVPVAGIPATAVATQIGIAAGVQYGTSIAASSAAQGVANGFGYGLALGGGLFYLGTGAVIYLEASAIVHYAQAAKMFKVIEQSHQIVSGNERGKHSAFNRFVDRLNRRHPETKDRTDLEIATEIVRLDTSGALCDGSLKTRPSNSLKLKRLLAKPRELIDALASDID